MDKMASASVIGPEKIREIVKEELKKGDNPCLTKLLFMETRAKGEHPRKIFPAYPFDIVSGKDGDVLVVFLVQYLMKTYNTACITFPMKDIGVTCRFWDVPPTDAAMDAFPLKDTAEVQ